jgi:MFS transporter, PAT family, beta-lactamase induction signal transducer AmpG
MLPHSRSIGSMLGYSRRTAIVGLQSFASGLPLGLVWYAVPDWLRDAGVDIQVVGLITLAQAPWTFKVLWAPLVDRFTPPFWGRRRGWMALMQATLFVLSLLLAGVGERPEAVWMVGAIVLAMALASATQDIAIDAYAVELLRREEQGAAAGARTALYRTALLVTGGASISLAARIGWPAVNVLLGCLYLPMLLLTWRSPELEVPVAPPRTLREAVWDPLLNVLSRPRALEILAFVVLYKFSDQLTQSLVRPFLVDMGYGADDRGLALTTIGVVGFVAGSFVGGWMTTLVGLGHALWAFGFLQLFSNLGYYWLALLDGPSPLAMYVATGFEMVASGLGTGAFSVLLLRLTVKRFSATQYALLSSLFALPRVLAGPITGLTVSALGWPAFYLAATVAGLPGLMMLGRFVPLGVREPDVEPPAAAAATASARRFPAAAVFAGVALAAVAVLIVSALDALVSNDTVPGIRGAFGNALWRLLIPVDAAGWVSLGGVAAFAIVGGMLFAAYGPSRVSLPTTDNR